MHTATWRTTVAATSAALLALALAPRSGAAQQAAANAVNEGARVYGDMCGRCHNPRSPLERSDRDWVVIANHMRVRGNLTGREVRSVLAFLQAMNTDPRERMVPPGPMAAPGTDPGEGPPSDDPEVIARGKALVQQNACLGCHVVERAGGQVGPTLNGVVRRRGAAFVRRKLIEPTFNNTTSMMPNFGLTAEQVEAILAYLDAIGR